MTALLQVEGLQTAYGASQVLFDITFSVQAGQTATLLGATAWAKPPRCVPFWG